MDSIPDELLIAIFAILVERALTDDQPSKATATTTTGTNHSSTPATKQSTVSRATSWFKRTLRVSANNTSTTTTTSSTVEDDDKQQLRSRDVPASTRVITSASQRAEAAKRQLILLGLVCKDWLRVSCDESLWRPIIDSVPHADINTLLRDVTGIANAASNWRKFMCSVVSIAKRNRVRGRQHNGVVPYHLRTIDALCSSGRWIVSASNSPYEACVWEVAPLLARLRSQRRGMRHWLTLRGTFLFHHAITAVTIASDGLAAVGYRISIDLSTHPHICVCLLSLSPSVSIYLYPCVLRVVCVFVRAYAISISGPGSRVDFVRHNHSGHTCLLVMGAIVPPLRCSPPVLLLSLCVVSPISRSRYHSRPRSPFGTYSNLQSI